MPTPKKQYVLVAGTFADGIYIVGPFDSHDEAVAYAEQDNPPCSWEVILLQAPATNDEEDNPS